MKVIVLGLLALQFIVLAIRIPAVQQEYDEGVSIDLERNPHSHEHKISMVNLLQRVHTYTLSDAIAPPKDITAFPEVGHKESGSDLNPDEDIDIQRNKISSAILLRNYFNTQFIGLIEVGSIRKKMRCIFDSGSTNLWVNSIRCKTPGCRRHRQYNWKSSKTFRKVGLPVVVRFGSGVLRGIVNREIVYLKGLKIPKQEIIEVKHQSQNVLNRGHYDAIVGLGLPKMAAHGFNPLFDNIIDQKILKNNLFSFYFDREMMASKSKLIFGGVDHSLYEGKLQYHPVKCDTYWAIDIDNVMIGGKDIGICSGKEKCRGIIDSGTSFITGPSQMVRTLLTNVRVAKGCKNFNDLPPISFVINGIEYSLDPWEYVLTVKKDKKPDPVYEHSDLSQIGHCAGLIMPLNLPGKYENYWILGDLFMSKYYSVFDRDKKRIGLAQAKGVLKPKTAEPSGSGVNVQIPMMLNSTSGEGSLAVEEEPDYYGRAKHKAKDIHGMNFAALSSQDDDILGAPNQVEITEPELSREQENDELFKHVVKNIRR